MGKAHCVTKLHDQSVSGKMPDAPKQRAYEQVLSGLLQQAERKLNYVCDEVKRHERLCATAARRDQLLAPRE